jgi:hypothetical protein
VTGGKAQDMTVVAAGVMNATFSTILVFVGVAAARGAQAPTRTEWLLRFRFSGDGYPLTGANNVHGIDDGGGTGSVTMSETNV